MMLKTEALHEERSESESSKRRQSQTRLSTTEGEDDDDKDNIVPRGGHERFDVVVIGGGQAGLAVGYYLAQRGLNFVILDGGERVGDAWRQRWDSLRLFSAARFDGLPGMPFPAPPHYFPTKDEMADYLESYAKSFELPVRTRTRVERVSKTTTTGGDHYVVHTAGKDKLPIEAKHVIVAMAGYQKPRIPTFASELRPDIVQLHSRDYQNPTQLQKGAVLIVGAGNSGGEIALEIANANVKKNRQSRTVFLAGRNPGEVPFRPDGFMAKLLLSWVLLRFVFHRVLTIRTPIGRKAKASQKGGVPLIRLRSKDLTHAGVRRTSRVVGVRNGLPLLEDGTVLDVANIIWSTGFENGFASWIDVPGVFERDGRPNHDAGVVLNEPGFYFVGLHFLFAMSSAMIHGVARDAARITKTIESRVHAS